MSADNSKPAFPSNIAFDYTGMTLRDYFAAKAIPTLQAQYMQHVIDGKLDPDIQDIMGMVAEDAYELADAMLKAGDK